MKATVCVLALCCAAGLSAADWRVGSPIVTYWCGPTLTDAAATQMAEGGFNLVWCDEGTLPVARRHGLRAMLQDGLIRPESLEQPERRQQLDALVERVKNQPALYAYFLTDEPNASQFAALGRLVAYLRRRDPAHLAYINLFPTYASNAQLGTTGDVVTAYREHVKRFVDEVRPALLSYDHYQFALTRDTGQYFLNLALIRAAAQAAGVPFLNIVQASTWAPESMRVPGSNEVRYLVYTTAAYGAQGLSYYIYRCANHAGGMAEADGKPTPLYHAVKSYNREFVALARELQPLRSLAVWHTAMQEPGCEALPAEAPFRLADAKQAEGRRGFLLGYFGAKQTPTHVLVVNLDYRAPASATLAGPGPLEQFEAGEGKWSKQGRAARNAELHFAPGEGRLLRLGK